MSGRKPVCKTLFYRIVFVGVILTSRSAQTFKKDFLCRPAGHCVNAADGGSSYEG